MRLPRLWPQCGSESRNNGRILRASATATVHPSAAEESHASATYISTDSRHHLTVELQRKLVRRLRVSQTIRFVQTLRTIAPDWQKHCARLSQTFSSSAQDDAPFDRWRGLPLAALAPKRIQALQDRDSDFLVLYGQEIA